MEYLPSAHHGKIIGSREVFPVNHMLAPGNSEKVVTLDDFPQSEAGAPCPALIATEGDLVIAFHRATPELWDRPLEERIDWQVAGESCAIVRFAHTTIHTFGPPNDEAFSGHRLAKKGLEPYGAFEVLNSEWIEQLEKMNSVHPMHTREWFMKGKRHFILTFHDSVFECVARGYTVELASGTVKDLLIAAMPTLHG